MWQQPQKQTITFGPLAASGWGDPAVTATASSGLPVTFTAAGTCTVTGANVHLTGVGTCTITAAQPGNNDYAAATPVQQAFTVEQPPAPR
jgi:hypothetical protein